MEARFSASVQTCPGAHPASWKMSTRSFPGVKRPGRGVDHPPHLAPRLKKKYSYISTPLWAFVDCYRVTFTFIIWFSLYQQSYFSIFFFFIFRSSLRPKGYTTPVFSCTDKGKSRTRQRRTYNVTLRRVRATIVTV